jgi:hypothetical protein
VTDGVGDEPRRQVGLCAGCLHHREVANRRGSTFHLCERWATDPRYAKYPPLPVLRCEGYEEEKTTRPDS